MSIKETITTLVSAPSVVRDTTGREYAKALAAASALKMQGDCAHCGGPGRNLTTTRLVVHCFASDLDWFGTNWDLPRVLAAINAAEYVRWEDSGGHDLVIEVDGQPFRFAVQRPAQVKDAGEPA